MTKDKQQPELRRSIMDEVHKAQAEFAALSEVQRKAAENELRSIFSNPGVVFRTLLGDSQP